MHAPDIILCTHAYCMFVNIRVVIGYGFGVIATCCSFALAYLR